MNFDIFRQSGNYVEEKTIEKEVSSIENTDIFLEDEHSFQNNISSTPEHETQFSFVDESSTQTQPWFSGGGCNLSAPPNKKVKRQADDTLGQFFSGLQKAVEKKINSKSSKNELFFKLMESKMDELEPEVQENLQLKMLTMVNHALKDKRMSSQI